MIIKKIHLKNIRSFVEEEIDFPTGSLLLTGDIGSGKSTILLAIDFALFGTRTSELSGASLLRNGADKGFVELELEIDGKGITILRTLKRSGDRISQGPGYIEINGIRTRGTTTEITSNVVDLLGYPKDVATGRKSQIFRYTVYTPQEMMKYIIRSPPDERLDILRKIFGLDDYKNIKDNTKIFLSHMKSQMKELKGTISDLNDKKSQSETYTNELKETQKELAGLSGEKTKIDSKLKKQEDCVKNLEDEKKNYDNLKNEKKLFEKSIESNRKSVKQTEKEISKIKQQISDLERKIKSFRQLKKPTTLTKTQIKSKIKKCEVELKSVNEQKSALREKLATLTSNLNQQEDKICESKEEIQKVNLEIKGIEKKLEEFEAVKKPSTLSEDTLDTTIAKLRQEKDELNGKKSRLSEKIESLEKILQDGICGTCEQTVQDKQQFESKIEGRRVEVDELKKEIAKNGQEILDSEKLLKELRQYNTKISENNNLKEKGEHLNKEISALESLISNAKEKKIELNKEIEEKKSLDFEPRLAKLEKDLEKLRNFLTQLIEYQNKKERLDDFRKAKSDTAGALKEKEAELEEARNSVKTAESDMKGIEKELKDAKPILSKYEKEKEQLEEIRDERLDFAKRESGLKERLRGQQSNIERVNEEIKAKEQIKENLAHLSQLENWLSESFLNLISLIEKTVMVSIQSEFNELFRRWFNTLVEDDNLNVRIDDGFTPIIDQNNYETEYEYTSGGEQTAVALAFRLALNRVINRLIEKIKTKEIIILDEPTDGFSRQQLDKVREVLDGLNCKQTIVVSHEPTVESFVDNTIQFVKENHISRKN